MHLQYKFGELRIFRSSVVLFAFRNSFQVEGVPMNDVVERRLKSRRWQCWPLEQYILVQVHLTCHVTQRDLLLLSCQVGSLSCFVVRMDRKSRHVPARFGPVNGRPRMSVWYRVTRPV